MRLIKGKPVSHGYAIGNVYIYKSFSCDTFESYFEKDQECGRIEQYEKAVELANEELDEMISLLQDNNDDKYKIFVAHQEILHDEEIDEQIRNLILTNHAMPDYAVDKTFSFFAVILSKAKDPLIAARAADLRDVRNRLIRVLHGEKEKNLSILANDVIVVAHDLLPSDTATLDRTRVLGIVTEVGGETSHSAIIARGYKIPAVLGVPEATAIFSDGEKCIVDAIEGTVYMRPNDTTIQTFTEKHAQYLKELQEVEKYLTTEPKLASGERISLGINVASAEASDEYKYCDFVGLLRTEFLYMQSDTLPSEDVQYKSYLSVIRNAKGKPITLRTLDIGGDKTLKYLELPHEDNPFLGKRALRLCLDNPEIFNTQLRAALRASAEGEIWLMFPMVGTIDDIRNARKAVEHAKAELYNEGIPYDENIKIGIMIEIPAIAQICDLAVKEVDFASVGTNDLTQYTHAVDRMNSSITDYYQSFSPAMFRLLENIISTFNKAGKPISICGEMGGDPLAMLVLVGLGLRKTSMSGSNIAKMKHMLSCFSLQETKEIASKVINMATQQEILEFLNEVLIRAKSKTD